MHENSGDTVPDNTFHEEVNTGKPTEVRTSSCLRTVINYKQFLEEYVNGPPQPHPERNVKWI